MSKGAFIAFIVIAGIIMFLAGYNIASMTNYRKITNLASIKAIDVEVFEDQNCTVPIEAIDWGTLEPSSSKNIQIYVKSLSNVPFTLTIYADNWKPSNCTLYMTFNAEPNNVLINPSESLEVELSLRIFSNITGITNFSFEIWLISIG